MLESLQIMSASNLYVCDKCKKSYTRKNNLKVHTTIKHNPNPKMHKCDKCNYTSPYLSNLRLHYSRQHENILKRKSSAKESPENKPKKQKIDPIVQCDDCGKKFSYKKSLIQHLKMIHDKNRKLHQCPDCDYKSPYLCNLRMHQTIHSKQQLIRRKNKQTVLLNVTGLPEPENIFNFTIQTLMDEGYCTEAAECLVNSAEFVRTKYTGGNVRRQYNIRLTNEELDIYLLKELLLKIHDLQSSSYRINIGFGCLLQHNQTEEWRYYYPSNDPTGRYWPEPFTITSKEDLLKAMEYMDTQDIHDYLTLKRPETPYVLRRVVCFNVVLFLLPDTALLGGTINLPKHIMTHRYIKSLLKTSNGKFLKGSNCCFRCISTI